MLVSHNTQIGECSCELHMANFKGIASDINVQRLTQSLTEGGTRKEIQPVEDLMDSDPQPSEGVWLALVP